MVNTSRTLPSAASVSASEFRSQRLSLQRVSLFQEAPGLRPPVESFIPLYSGGLCEAVKLIPQTAPSVANRMRNRRRRRRLIAKQGAKSMGRNDSCAFRRESFPEKARVVADHY